MGDTPLSRRSRLSQEIQAEAESYWGHKVTITLYREGDTSNEILDRDLERINKAFPDATFAGLVYSVVVDEPKDQAAS